MNRQQTSFYDEHPFDWTGDYDVAALQSTLALPLQAFINELPADALVLDMGCGAGRVTACLASSRLRCIGLDVSRNSVQLMAERTGIFGVVGDALRLPFANGSLDRVIADGVIHHTPDPSAAFAECCRVLKPGGAFYAAVYKSGGRYEKLYRFPGAVIRRLVKNRLGRTFVHSTALPVYYLAHKAKSRGKRSWRGAKNLFYDYFVTPCVEFIPRAELDRWSLQNGVDLLSYHPNPQLNVHSFILQKNGRNGAL